MRGNATKYMDLLHRFVDMHHDDMTRLAGSLADHDQVTAQRLVHTLKGAAATLGFDHVADIAQRLEARIRADPDASVQGDGIRSELDAIRHAFTTLAAALLAAPSNVTADRDQAWRR